MGLGLVMRKVLVAAAAYWGGVFAAAFVIGAVRTVWIAPRIGALAATALEVPVVLAISGFAARAATAHWHLRQREAAAMGGAAFVLLMFAEWALAQAFGQSTAAWLGAMATAPGALGLAGQAGFGVMPWVVCRFKGK